MEGTDLHDVNPKRLINITRNKDSTIDFLIYYGLLNRTIECLACGSVIQMSKCSQGSDGSRFIYAWPCRKKYYIHIFRQKRMTINDGAFSQCLVFFYAVLKRFFVIQSNT